MKNKRVDRGVTLIEVLVAMTILLIVFMGLIQASILAISVNMRNDLRDEAVNLTSELMNKLRAAPFDDLDGAPTPASTPLAAAPASPDPLSFTVNPVLTLRTIRNAAVQYSVRVDIVLIDADHKQITLTTSWSWQGEAFNHIIVAFRGRS